MTVPWRGAARLLLVLVAALAAVVLAARHIAPVPDLLVLLLTAVGLVGGPAAGLGWGLVAGWFVDVIPPGATVLGLGALTYAAAGAVAGGWHRVDRIGPAWVALATVATALVVEGSRVVLALATTAPVDWAGVGLRLALTATVSTLVVPLLVRADQRLAPPGER